MPMRSIHGAALVFAATLAATVGSPGPAEAFFFLPMLAAVAALVRVQIRQDPERQ